MWRWSAVSGAVDTSRDAFCPNVAQGGAGTAQSDLQTISSYVTENAAFTCQETTQSVRTRGRQGDPPPYCPDRANRAPSNCGLSSQKAFRPALTRTNRTRHTSKVFALSN
jgi:hypothetical protein